MIYIQGLHINIMFYNLYTKFIELMMLVCNGYMVPEYAMHGHFSVKSDVYSFGVLILEILNGNKISFPCQSDATEDLLSYVSN